MRGCQEMDPSPLTQQARPEVFKPKVVELYERLFKVRYNVSIDDLIH